MKTKIYPLDTVTHAALPFVEEGIKAGFPSPAQDLQDIGIDLNEALIEHPATTFLAKVDGDSMQEANILDGDILVIDRELTPSEGDVAICYINGEFTVKRLQRIKGTLYLVPANKEFKAIEITEGDDLTIWGIVTYCIHKVR